MIYDTFTFYNELDLLEIRLNTLSNVVDKFVLVESTKTFTGKEKPLYFWENRKRYEKFLDRIIYIKVEDMPETTDAWEREDWQRDAIGRGLRECNQDDLIIVSDVDEVVSPEAVLMAKRILKSHEKAIVLFEVLFMYYYLNYLDFHEFFLGAPKMFYYRLMQEKASDDLAEKLPQNHIPTANTFRKSCFDYKVIMGGWHFSYLGGAEKIAQKIDAFSHQEYNTAKYTDQKTLEEKIESGEDLFGRNYKFSVLQDTCFYPEYLIEQKENYRNYFCNYCNVEKKIYQKAVRKLKIKKFISRHYPLLMLYNYSRVKGRRKGK